MLNKSWLWLGYAKEYNEEIVALKHNNAYLSALMQKREATIDKQLQEIDSLKSALAIQEATFKETTDNLLTQLLAVKEKKKRAAPEISQ